MTSLAGIWIDQDQTTITITQDDRGVDVEMDNGRGPFRGYVSESDDKPEITVDFSDVGEEISGYLEIESDQIIWSNRTSWNRLKAMTSFAGSWIDQDQTTITITQDDRRVDVEMDNGRGPFRGYVSESDDKPEITVDFSDVGEEISGYLKSHWIIWSNGTRWNRL
jgi:hypothetical protein